MRMVVFVTKVEMPRCKEGEGTNTWSRARVLQAAVGLSEIRVVD